MAIAAVEGPPLQPAVIVGLGYFGADVCRILRQRRELRRRFSPRTYEVEEGLIRLLDIGNDFEDIVPGTPFSLLYDGQESRTELVTLLHSYLETVCTYIHNQLQDVCATRVQPNSLWVNPTIYLVLSVSELIGSAALSPLAAALVDSIAYDIQFKLVGAVMLGHREDQPKLRQHAEALAFTALIEAQELVLQTGSEQLPVMERSHVPLEDTIYSEPLFDHLYLFDHVKGNNSTLSPLPGVSTEEAEVHVASFLEAMVLSPLPSYVNRQLLDDYASPISMALATGGTSSLVVPIDRLWDAIRQETTANILGNHLSTVPPDERRLLNEAAELRLTLARDNLQESLRQLFAVELRHSASPGSDSLQIYGVRTSLKFNEEGIPQLVLFRPVVDWQSMTALDRQTIQDNLQGEQQGVERFARRVASAILVDRLPEVASQSINEIRQEALNGLNADERGLSRALAYLKESERLVSEHFVEVGRWYDQHPLRARSGRWRRWVTRLVEDQAAERRLDQIINWVSYPSAMIVRAVLLWMLLDQLYYDALNRDALFWPFRQMGTVSASYIAWFLWAVIGSGVLIATVAPLFFLNLERQFRRIVATQNAREHVQEALQDGHRQFWEDLHLALSRDVRTLESHYLDMQTRREELMRAADRVTEAVTESYLERAVISVSQLKAEQGPPPPIETFVPYLQTLTWYQGWSNSPLDRNLLLSIAAISELVDEAVDRVLTPHVVARSIEDYLVAVPERRLLEQKAYDSAIPWLLVTATAMSQQEQWFLPELLTLDARVAASGQPLTTPSSADWTRSFITVEGLDRFRATTLRLQYGLELNQINRMVKLERSFRLLPPSQRAQYIVDEALYAPYPALRSDPLLDVTEPEPEGHPQASDQRVSPEPGDSPPPLPPLDVPQLLGLFEGRDNANRGLQDAKNRGDTEAVARYHDALQGLTDLLQSQGIISWTPPLGEDVMDYLNYVHVTASVQSSHFPIGTISEVWRDAYEIPQSYFDSAPSADFIAVGDTWIRCAHVAVSAGAHTDLGGEG